MKALIDGDLILYAAGFASEIRYYSVSNEETGHTFQVFKTKEKGAAKAAKEFCEINEGYTYTLVTERCDDAVWKGNVNSMVRNILKATGATSSVLYLTGEGNYREEIYPEYKANRKDVPKPLHYAEIKEYLIERHSAVVVDGMEADDAMGIAQKGKSTCICSIDKDMLMIKGRHYQWNKKDTPSKGKMSVTQAEADRFFWTQVLTGDMTDNIVGLKGVGPVKAKKMLEECTDNLEMFNVCYEAYGVHERSNEDMKLNATLLWIKRSEDSEWEDLIEGE